jgi:hypothetical protein
MPVRIVAVHRDQCEWRRPLRDHMGEMVVEVVSETRVSVPAQTVQENHHRQPPYGAVRRHHQQVHILAPGGGSEGLILEDRGLCGRRRGVAAPAKSPVEPELARQRLGLDQAGTESCGTQAAQAGESGHEQSTP